MTGAARGGEGGQAARAGLEHPGCCHWARRFVRRDCSSIRIGREGNGGRRRRSPVDRPRETEVRICGPADKHGLHEQQEEAASQSERTPTTGASGAGSNDPGGSMIHRRLEGPRPSREQGRDDWLASCGALAKEAEARQFIFRAELVSAAASRVGGGEALVRERRYANEACSASKLSARLASSPKEAAVTSRGEPVWRASNGRAGGGEAALGASIVLVRNSSFGPSSPCWLPARAGSADAGNESISKRRLLRLFGRLSPDHCWRRYGKAPGPERTGENESLTLGPRAAPAKALSAPGGIRLAERARRSERRVSRKKREGDSSSSIAAPGNETAPNSAKTRRHTASRLGRPRTARAARVSGEPRYQRRRRHHQSVSLRVGLESSPGCKGFGFNGAIEAGSLSAAQAPAFITTSPPPTRANRARPISHLQATAKASWRHKELQLELELSPRPKQKQKQELPLERTLFSPQAASGDFVRPNYVCLVVSNSPMTERRPSAIAGDCARCRLPLALLSVPFTPFELGPQFEHRIGLELQLEAKLERRSRSARVTVRPKLASKAVSAAELELELGAAPAAIPAAGFAWEPAACIDELAAGRPGAERLRGCLARPSCNSDENDTTSRHRGGGSDDATGTGQATLAGRPHGAAASKTHSNRHATELALSEAVRRFWAAQGSHSHLASSSSFSSSLSPRARSSSYSLLPHWPCSLTWPQTPPSSSLSPASVKINVSTRFRGVRPSQRDGHQRQRFEKQRWWGKSGSRPCQSSLSEWSHLSLGRLQCCRVAAAAPSHDGATGGGHREGEPACELNANDQGSIGSAEDGAQSSGGGRSGDKRDKPARADDVARPPRQQSSSAALILPLVGGQQPESAKLEVVLQLAAESGQTRTRRRPQQGLNGRWARAQASRRRGGGGKEEEEDGRGADGFHGAGSATTLTAANYARNDNNNDGQADDRANNGGCRCRTGFGAADSGISSGKAGVVSAEAKAANNNEPAEKGAHHDCLDAEEQAKTCRQELITLLHICFVDFTIGHLRLLLLLALLERLSLQGGKELQAMRKQQLREEEHQLQPSPPPGAARRWRQGDVCRRSQQARTERDYSLREGRQRPLERHSSGRCSPGSDNDEHEHSNSNESRIRMMDCERPRSKSDKSRPQRQRRPLSSLGACYDGGYRNDGRGINLVAKGTASATISSQELQSPETDCSLGQQESARLASNPGAGAAPTTVYSAASSIAAGPLGPTGACGFLQVGVATNCNQQQTQADRKERRRLKGSVRPAAAVAALVVALAASSCCSPVLLAATSAGGEETIGGESLVAMLPRMAPKQARPAPVSLAGKSQFWAQLTGDLLGATRAAGGNWAAVERIAERLSAWPDQRQAALLYIDLLARRRDRIGAALAAGSGDEKWCRRASLAELEAASANFRLPMLLSWQHQQQQQQPSFSASDGRAAMLDGRGWPPSSQQPGVLLLESVRSSIRANELSQETTARALLGKLNQEMGFADLAKLAVENADLISRLSIHATPSADQSAAGRASQRDSGEQEQEKEEEEEELLIRPLVSRRFFKYLLESKARQFGASHPQLHSLGLVFFEPVGAGRGGEEARRKATGSSPFEAAGEQGGSEAGEEQLLTAEARSAWFAQLALPRRTARTSPAEPGDTTTGGDRANVQVDTVDLIKHKSSGDWSSPSGYFRPLVAPTFISKWLLGADEELRQLERRLSRLLVRTSLSSQDGANSGSAEDDSGAGRQQAELQRAGYSLNIADGRWFSPYFDCGVSNRWLLTYSVPFFASRSEHANSSGGSNGSIGFRGVSFVSLDFARLKLIDQCAPENGAAFLANTHHCSRLQRSQCVRLEDFEQVRSGAYICQCPTGSGVPADERRANEEFREKLNELLGQLASANSTHALDSLGLELDETLGDKAFVADQLVSQAKRKQSQQASHREGGEPGQHLEPQQQPRSGEPNFKQRPGKPSGSSSNLNMRHSQSRFARQAVQQQQRRFFALGAQLGADANLEWFTKGQPRSLGGGSLISSGPPASSDTWPAQVCRLCKRRAPQQHPRGGAAANSSRAATSSDDRPLDTNNDDGTFDRGRNQRDQEQQQLADSELVATCSEFQDFRFNWIRPVILALQSSCALATLALIGILLRVRKSRIILVSGWLMLETTLVGGLLLYSSVFVRYFQPSSITCLLEPWLRELGFSTFYGSILIKLYRILTEFQTRKAHRVCFRDKDQVVYLLAIVLIVVGYMSAWTALMVDGFLFGRQQSQQQQSQSRPQQAHWQQSLEWPQANASSAASEAAANSGALGGQERSSLLGVDFNSFEPLQTYNQLLSLNYSMASDGQLDREASSQGDATPTGSFAELAAEPANQLAGHLADLVATEQLKLLASNLNSFTDLFSGLLETEQQYDEFTDSLTYSTRCRKLTWDYITELSEMGLLLFGIHLVYKLRNASSEVHKEKLVLCASVFIELFVSAIAYTIRHLLWSQLSSDQLLALYFVRCQLTVTLTIGLVFGPKLWSISRSKPTLFFSSGGGRTTGGSMRHRCHLTCEIHDHHLNDAMRLHQAMLSNAALDIGSINLADMDPDEIQAELKRVYAQLEVLKTKAMRRDNPHISKRRGGRKPGHRKFSLQAFHAKHIGGHHHSSTSSASAQQTASEQQQQQSAEHGHQATSAGSIVGADCCTVGGRGEHRASTGTKLPVLVEQESNQQEENKIASRQDVRRTSSIERRVKVDESTSGTRQQQQLDRATSATPTAAAPTKGSSGAGQNQLRSTNWNASQNRFHQQQQQARQTQRNTTSTSGGGSRRPIIVADPNSTNSVVGGGGGVYFDYDTTIPNDSQSSGNVSPQRQSSFVCSQSSIHPDDSPVN